MLRGQADQRIQSLPPLVHRLVGQAVHQVQVYVVESRLAGWEHIGLETACSETMFLGLRLLDGLDLADASTQLGVDLAKKYRTQIQDCIQLGLLQQSGDCLRLTEPAYLIANQAFTRFLE